MKKLKNNQGLTLVELIITMAIFGMMSITLISIFSSALMVIVRTGDLDEAISASASELDEYRVGENMPAGMDISATREITIEYESGNVSLPGVYTYSQQTTVEGQTVTLRGFR